MKHIPTLIVALATTICMAPNVISQESDPTNNPDPNGSIPSYNPYYELLSKLNGNTINYTDIEGSRFRDSIYTKAFAVNTKNNPLKEYLARYNACTDEMETVDETGSVLKFEKSDLKQIVLNGETFKVLDFADDRGNEIKGYFIQKSGDDKCSLFLRETKTIKEGVIAKTGYHKNTNSKFIDHTKYYIKFGSSQPIPIDLKKKQILRTFPNHLKKLENYCSEHKLSLKTERDLLTLIEYYNSMD